MAPSVPPSLTISDEMPLTVFLVLKASGIIHHFPFQLVKNELCSAGYVQLQVDSPERTVSMNMPMYGLVNKLYISYLCRILGQWDILLLNFTSIGFMNFI